MRCGAMLAAAMQPGLCALHQNISAALHRAPPGRSRHGSSFCCALRPRQHSQGRCAVAPGPRQRAARLR